MKAMLLTEYNKPLSLVNADDPLPGDDDIILKVRGAGMCYTDIKIVTGQLDSFIRLPHIPGHETAGEIVETGKNVKDLKVGQKGVVYPVISCGKCFFCLTGNENVCSNTVRLGFEADGGFAEYIKIPAKNFCSYDFDISFEKMAILADAVGTPYHALTKIASPKIGRPVLITGVGGLGLHAVQIAKSMGSCVIACDIKDDALDAASKNGADFCFNTSGDIDMVKEIKEITGGIGVDIVLEGVGKPETVSWSLKCLRKQGTFIIMGYNPLTPITLPFIDIHNYEWRIIGTKVCTKQDLLEVISLVEKGVISPNVEKVMKLEQLNDALDLVRNHKTIGRICIKDD